MTHLNRMDQGFPFMTNQPISRDIVLSGVIDEQSAGRVIAIINEINNEDEENERTLKDYQRTPIKLYIHSGGGDPYSGMGIVDAIGFSGTPVITICFGIAMSAAFWVYLAGLKRIAGKHATFMYHEISGGLEDKLSGIKQEAKEMDRVQNLYDSFIKENTNINQEKLDYYRTTKSEWYISAEEAYNFGICDNIAENVFDRKQIIKDMAPKKFKVKNQDGTKTTLTQQNKAE